MNLFKKLILNRISLIGLTVFISVITICVSLLWNAQLSFIINRVNLGKTVPLRTIIFAGIIMLASSGMAYVLGICSGWTCETLAHDLRMGYAKNLIDLPISEIENMNAGDQLSKLQNEINEVSGFLHSNLFSIIDDLIRFIGSFSWLLWLNPKLTLLANAPAALLMWYTLYASKVIGQAALKSQQANANMTGFADTLITLFPIIRLFDANQLLHRQYDDALVEWKTATLREERRKAQLMSPSGLFSYIPLLILLLIGGKQIIQGTLTIGTLYVFINLSGNVSGVMMNLPGRIAGFRRFVANMHRLEPSVLFENGGH
jgi:ABC-type bacteriocin/lantibiotic exporter with double-glycine peptidase domain